jgi:hypothetical protein
MRVLILCLTAVLVAGCAGRSAPDEVAAPAVATPAVATPAVPATSELPTDAETIQASTLTGNEPVCKRRPVTGSIIWQRVCEGDSVGLEEAVGQEQIRNVFQGLERNHVTGDLIRR